MSAIWQASFYALAVMLVMAFLTWLYSLYRKDVSIVDSLWSLMFLAAAITYAISLNNLTERNMLLLVMVTLWALRLSIFLTVRNSGKEEDRRYQEIRANNQPYFNIKSLYIIFGLQAVLAWIVSMPLLFAFSSDAATGVIELVAIALWLTGFLFESVSDQQLYRFKADSTNKGKVLNSGLWAYSRHPNYFGEFLIWWGYFLFALSSGAWWTVLSPILMTFLLLKVSGVSLMEKDITDRRDDYRQYIQTTNAFFPGKPALKKELLHRGQQS